MLLPAMKKLATRVRYDIVTMTTTAGSGHPTSSLSATDLMTTLFFKYIHVDVDHPKSIVNDRVIFSKGHASPLLFALWHVAGVISDKELMTYRTFGSRLEGHPTPRFPYVDVATGSLGQGLAVGVGEALALRIKNLSASPHIFILMGDGELAEGSVWEAAMIAGYTKTKNCIAIVDVNRLGQSGATMEGWDTKTYQVRFEAFGWNTIVIDGHDLKEIDVAFQKAVEYKNGPVAIIAKTVKGKGISFLEDTEGWHGKTLTKEQCDAAIAELGTIDTSFEGMIKKPEIQEMHEKKSTTQSKNPDLHITSCIHDMDTQPCATREAFGKTLAALGAVYPELVVIDGDVNNSTYTKFFKDQFPERFFEGFIAEQTMVGMAMGAATFGLLPVVSTFASFLSRAADQFRMAAISGTRMIVNGSHVGVSIGADGPSQMGVEDIALFRALPQTVVLQPADAISAGFLTACACQQDHITYIRTMRSSLPNMYHEHDQFTVGGSHVFLEKTAGEIQKKVVTIIVSGVTVHEALHAKQQLEKEGIPVRVIDCYSIKPMDEKTIIAAFADSTTLIIAEDHVPQGGLGEAVLSVLSYYHVDTMPTIHHLAVRKPPMSGSMEELLQYEEIDASAMIAAAKK